MNQTARTGVDPIVGGTASGRAYAASRERIVGFLTQALGDETFAREAIQDERFESVVIRLSRSNGRDPQAAEEARRLFFGELERETNALDLLTRIFLGSGGKILADDVLARPGIEALVAPVMATHGALAEHVRRLQEAVLGEPPDSAFAEEDQEPCVEDAGLLCFTVRSFLG